MKNACHTPRCGNWDPRSGLCRVWECSGGDGRCWCPEYRCHDGVYKFLANDCGGFQHGVYGPSTDHRPCVNDITSDFCLSGTGTEDDPTPARPHCAASPEGPWICSPVYADADKPLAYPDAARLGYCIDVR